MGLVDAIYKFLFVVEMDGWMIMQYLETIS